MISFLVRERSERRGAKVCDLSDAARAIGFFIFLQFSVGNTYHANQNHRFMLFVGDIYPGRRLFNLRA